MGGLDESGSEGASLREVVATGRGPSCRVCSRIIGDALDQEDPGSRMHGESPGRLSDGLDGRGACSERDR